MDDALAGQQIFFVSTQNKLFTSIVYTTLIFKHEIVLHKFDTHTFEETLTVVQHIADLKLVSLY